MTKAQESKWGKEYQGKRTAFFNSMDLNGMERDSANYCITIGRRLRDVYMHSTQVATQEQDAVEKLAHMLGRLQYQPWSYVLGGLHEGDDTVLYVVPPGQANGAEPIPVPLPPLSPPVPASGVELDAPTGLDAAVLEELRQKAATWSAAFKQMGQRQMIERQRQMREQMLAVMTQEAKAIVTRDDERNERLEIIRAGIEQRAVAAGWDTAIRSTVMYGTFVDALMRFKEAEMEGRFTEAQRYEETGRELHSQLSELAASQSVARQYFTSHHKGSMSVDLNALEALRQRADRSRYRK